MTKVMRRMDKGWWIGLGCALVASVALGQNHPKLSQAPLVATNAAESLFLKLGSVGLDPSRVYLARNLSFDRPGFSMTLDNGTVAFTEDVEGHVTGAFFEGDGEVLLLPPNQVERGSMALFTGSAILEEHFVSGYFRFNDETFGELKPYLREAENAAGFVSLWNETAKNLAQIDALRLFIDFSQLLPVGGSASANELPTSVMTDHRFLHARLQGQKQGIFDVYYDARAPEPVWAGQFRLAEGYNFYDVWSSFSPSGSKATPATANSVASEEGRGESIDISDVKIRAQIKPPTTLDAEADLQLHVNKGGQRSALFELARDLVIKEVQADGQPVEFIHNPAMDGTQLAKRGNDLVAVVFAQPLQTGQRIRLHFVYGGEVLSQAGPGLLLVGARGTWYPNRGIAMSNFDLEFRYPPGWTLVATGKRVDKPDDAETEPATDSSQEQMSHWVSERPIPIAGFNLGKYQRAAAQAGNVTVAAYATQTVERGFPQQQVQVSPDVGGINPPIVITPLPVSPARNAEMVARTSAHAIDVFSRDFGPYPFSSLSLTQKPGNLSQGWPGLIFLSSLSFLSPEEESNLHMSAVEKALIKEVISHETAHQWWGDLVTWSGYRDQWTSEGLANYSSLMLFEDEQPAEFRAIMNGYREDLLEKNKAGVSLMQAGPVTLGTRLSCSQFPNGYEDISYGRGTWLFYMLRHMMRDAEPKSERGSEQSEPFIRALRKLRDRYEGKSVTTRQMLQVFEEELPRSLWFQGHRSLGWFYDGWVNGTSVPRIELRNVRFAAKEGGMNASGVIMQKDAPADLVTSVPLYAARGNKLEYLGRVFADGTDTPFHLAVPVGTRKIVVDAGQTLLARTQ
ncbi:MAG TPA: M1 family aminopeptidase [Terriglobales bacterium]|nr:M1 family aminopeptidase [Terriglobales bacterium]